MLPVRQTSDNSGSAAGPDKLGPQHLKELTTKQTGEAGARLLQALTALANIMLAGKVPDDVLPVLYGANLIALSKPGGGIRPIVVGNILRRMTAKCVVLMLGGEVGELLRPTQLWFGTPGGYETVVDATRRYLSTIAEMSPHILLKLDYKNALNTLRRDHLLHVVKDELPQLYPFIWQLYSSPLELFFRDTILQCASGVQGDHLGPVYSASQSWP